MSRYYDGRKRLVVALDRLGISTAHNGIVGVILDRNGGDTFLGGGVDSVVSSRGHVLIFDSDARN